MADGKVKVKITGDTSELKRAVKDAESSISGLEKGFGGAKSAVGKMGSFAVGTLKGIATTAAAATAAIAGIGKGVITAGQSFESMMSEVQALSGASAADFERLEETAKHYGETTAFSATQAAEALKYMSLAGWNADQSISALGGVLNLAASGGMGLGQASDMVTDYLSAFGLGAEKASDMANKMSFAQANSNTSATQLGEAFGNCATNMRSAGQTMETTTALLMGLADVGNKGSTAGTALSAITASITQKMDKGAITINKQKIAVQDANGNWRNMIDILAEVEEKTKGLGSTQRSAALSAVFNRQSLTAVNSIFARGIDDIAAYQEQVRGVDDAFAETSADTMMDNLGGAMKIMDSAIEGLQLTMYDSVDGIAKTAVSGATQIVSQINDVVKNGFNADSMNGIVDSMFKLVGDVAKQVEPIFESVVKSISSLVPKLLPNLVKGIGALMKGVAKQMPTFVRELISTLPSILENLGSVFGDLTEVLLSGFGVLIENLISTIPQWLPSLVKALGNVFLGAFNGIGNLVWKAADGVFSVLGIKSIDSYSVNLEKAVSSIDKTKTAEVSAQIDGKIEPSKDLLTSIETSWKGVTDTIDELDLSKKVTPEWLLAHIGQSAQHIEAELKKLGLSDDEAQTVANSMSSLNEQIKTALDELDIKLPPQTIAKMFADSKGNREQLYASLREQGLTATQIDGIEQIYDSVGQGVSDSISQMYTDIHTALTDGKTDTPQVIQTLIDEVTGNVGNTKAVIENQYEAKKEEVKKNRDSYKTPQEYQDALFAVETEKQAALSQADTIGGSMIAWINEMANAEKGVVEDNIAYLEELIAQLDALTQVYQTKVETSSPEAKAFEAVSSGYVDPTDTVTIGLAVDYVIANRDQALEDLQTQETEALESLKSQNLEPEVIEQKKKNILEYYRQQREAVQTGAEEQAGELARGISTAMGDASQQAIQNFAELNNAPDIMYGIMDYWDNTPTENFDASVIDSKILSALGLDQTADAQTFETAAQNYFDTAAGAVDEALVGTTWSNIADTLSEASGEALADVDFGAVGTIWDALDKNGFWGSEEDAPDLGQFVTDAFADVDLDTALEDAGEHAGEGFDNGLANKKEVITGTAEDLAQATPDAFQRVLDMHSPSKVTEELGGFAAEGFSNGLSNGVSSVAASANAVASAAANAIGSAETQFYSSGMNSGQGFSNGIAGATGSASASAIALASAAVNGINSSASQFQTAGQNAGEGFAKGLESKRSTLIDRARSLANSVASAIRLELQIHSPSKVMQQLGEYTGEGFEVGISDSLRSAVATARSVVGDMNLKPSLGIESLGDSISALSDTMNGDGGNVYLNVNGKTLAQVTAGDNNTAINGYQRRIALGLGRG